METDKDIIEDAIANISKADKNTIEDVIAAINKASREAKREELEALFAKHQIDRIGFDAINRYTNSSGGIIKKKVEPMVVNLVPTHIFTRAVILEENAVSNLVAISRKAATSESTVFLRMIVYLETNVALAADINLAVIALLAISAHSIIQKMIATTNRKVNDNVHIQYLRLHFHFCTTGVFSWYDYDACNI